MGNILNNICIDEESKYIKINNFQRSYTPDRYKARRKNSYFKSYIDFNNTKIKSLENSSLLNWRRNRPFQYMNEVNKSFSMSHSPIKQFNRLNFKANLNKKSNIKEKIIGDVNKNVSDMNKTIKDDIDINNNHVHEYDQINKKDNDEVNMKEFIPFEIIDMNNLNFLGKLIITPIENKYLCKNEISLELLSSYDNKIYNHYLRLRNEYNLNNIKKYQYNINHIDESENEFEDDVNICDFDKHKEKINADKIFFNTFDYNNEEINNEDKAFYDYNVNIIEKDKEYTIIQNNNQIPNRQNGQIFDNANLSYISSKSKKKYEIIRNDFYIQRYYYEGYDISNNFKKSKLERNKVCKIKLAKSLYLEQSNKRTKRRNFNDRNRNTKLNECIQYTCSSAFKDKIEDLIDTPFKRKDKLEIKLLNVHVKKKDNIKKCELNNSNMEEIDKMKMNENINNEINNDFNEIYPSVSQIKQKIGEVNNKIESLNLSKLKMKKINKKQKRFEEYSKTENSIKKNRKEIICLESILKKKEILNDSNFILELSNLRLSRIVFPISHSETRIKKNFMLNDKEICISFNRIIYSYIEYKDEGVNTDKIIIFDGQIEKISYLKTGFKSVERYFQVTTNEFKYFNSVFSSSVWNNKPLFSISLKNIVSISFSSKNESIISKDINSNKLLKVVFDMEVLIDESFIEENLLEAFQLRPKEEIKLKEQDIKIKKNENLLKKVVYTFGSNDEDLGICLMNVIILAKDTRNFIDKYTK